MTFRRHTRLSNTLNKESAVMTTTESHLTEADVEALDGVIVTWGNAIYRDGYELPGDFAAYRDGHKSDDEEVGRRQLGRLAAVSAARDTVGRRMAELVEDGRLAEPVADTVWVALEPWSKHRWELGRLSRRVRADPGHSGFTQAKRQAEERDQQLRDTWTALLYAVVNESTTDR